MKHVHRIVVLVFVLLACASILPARSQETRVLIVMTSTASSNSSSATTGYNAKEVIHPYYVFLQGGWSVDFASPQGGRAPVDPASIDSSDKRTRYYLHDDSLLQERLKHTIAVKDIYPEKYDAILFIGGGGALWDLRNDAVLGKVAARIFGKRGILATIGEGAVVLLSTFLTDGVPVYKGVRLTSATDEEMEATFGPGNLPISLETAFRDGGAIHFKMDPFTPNTIVEHRVITGQNAASALGVAQAMIAKWKELSKEH